MITFRKPNPNTATPQLLIVVPTPLYGGSLPIASHAADAFTQLGHQCHVLAFDEHYALYNLLGQKTENAAGQKLQGRFAELLADFAVEQAIAASADLVWYTAQSPVSVNGLRRLRSNGIKSALWFVEDVRRFEYWKYLVAEYDVVFTIQKGPAQEAMRQAGARNVVYLPCAANPGTHHPQQLSAETRERYGSEVSFVGAGYPNRVELFSRLHIPKLKLWGNDWPAEWQPRLQEKSRRVTPEETAAIYNASTINLNIHSTVGLSALEYGDFVNPRTFEIAACAAFQIVNDQSPLRELFSNDELAIVNSEEEIERAITHYLAHPEERRIKSEAALARVQKEHTYVHRMETALTHLLSVSQQASKPLALPTFADLKTAAWGDEEMQLFLAQFNDGESASLAKMSDKVNARNGELSRAELTILLMQEFRNWGVAKGVIQ